MIRFNRILSVILIFILIFSYTASAEEKTTKKEPATTVFDEAKMGDADNDGKLSAADARLILRCSVKLEKPSEEALLYGDYDKNNKLSADDARTALRVAVGLDNIKCILHGHKLKEKTVKPTCTKDGYTKEYCTRCTFSSKKKTAITKATGHKLTEKSTAATCLEDGISTSLCSVCGFVKETKVTEKAKGHSFGIWQLQEETKSRTCSSCKLTETTKNEKTIYLTFDDGPGEYTEKILEILRENNIKATFFVTNQFPRYRYVLKDIVKDGHAIGVHSLTHQWSIYSDKKSYLDDFNAMHKIILDETGVDTRLFRFPGGTNNTVSCNYSTGIMKSLEEHMTKEGYFYFDWNVDSGDTTYYTASEIVRYTINQIDGRHSSVVLMHDIKSRTVEALKEIVRFGLENGYKFEAIDESTPRVQFRPSN